MTIERNTCHKWVNTDTQIKLINYNMLPCHYFEKTKAEQYNVNLTHISLLSQTEV